MAGRLVLVVGPSGAGKDTLIEGARAALAGDRHYAFVRRVVTRAADSAEDHDSVSEAEFARREAAGEFALSWSAHSLSYGIPADVIGEVAAGRVAVANVSRRVVASAKDKFPGAVVLMVEAPADIRRRRLEGRHREDDADIAARLARDVQFSDPEAMVVDNSGDREAGIERFVAALYDIAAR